MHSSAKRTKRRDSLQRATARVARHTIAIPTKPWDPTPMEARLRALAIEQTRGMWKGKRSLKEDLRWLKQLRATGDRKRRREQERLWKKLR